MSLLEDVFLEDETAEANDLERIIEGDGFEDQDPGRSSDDDNDGPRDDEAVEDKRRVDPSTTKPKNVTKNPRFVLNPARLTGPRGIQVIPEHFKDFKFKGKGHERDDLDLVLKKLEHWAYRLYPKFKFEDCLKKIETLGKKRTVAVHLHKIRSDQFTSDEIVNQQDSDDEADEATDAVHPTPDPQEDEFDQLLQQQIEIARQTPGSSRKNFNYNDISTPQSMPKATASPSISEEQKQRMIQNRLLAEQRRLARQQNILINNTNNITSNNGNDTSNNVNDSQDLSKINDNEGNPDNDTADDNDNLTADNDNNKTAHLNNDNYITANKVNDVIVEDDHDNEELNSDNKVEEVTSENNESDDHNDKNNSNNESNIDFNNEKLNEIVDNDAMDVDVDAV